MKTYPLIAAVVLGVSIFGCKKNESAKNSPTPGVQYPRGKPRPPALEKIAEFAGQQVTGIATNSSGRLFVSFPRWREGVTNSVVEIKSDGTQLPFPDQNWNTWNGQPREGGFTCVQSLLTNGNSLFILDPSNPEMKGVVGTPSLYEFDLQTNQLKNQWKFDENVAPPRSYLNDFRIDNTNKKIYISESGLGAILVLDLQTGAIRRVLDQDPSTKAEPLTLNTNGKAFVKQNGMPQRINVDGIEMSSTHLYFHALTGKHLYRLPLTALIDPAIAPAILANKVEDLGETPKPDGLLFDKSGNLFMGDLEKNAIVYRTPTGEIKTLIEDPSLRWADTLTLDQDGELLVTDSRLDQAIPGDSAANLIFNIYRVSLSTLRGE